MRDKAKPPTNASCPVRIKDFFLYHVRVPSSLGLSISPAGKLIYQKPIRSAKTTPWSVFDRKNIRLDNFYSPNTPGRNHCWRSIIHVFRIFLTQPMTTAVLSLTMNLFTLFGLAIFSLGLPMAFFITGGTAFIWTIRLTPPAAPANIKGQPAPSTVN